MFIYDVAKKVLVPATEMRTHESIVSLAVINSELVLCG